MVLSWYVSGSRWVPELMIRAGQTYKLITDHLGSVRMVVNVNTGAIVQQMQYDEFGRVISDTAQAYQPFGFAGGLYDAVTGLVRFGARDYDAEVGRWTAKDPILFDGGQGNLYVYAGNDLLNLLDITGLAPCPLGSNPDGTNTCEDICLEQHSVRVDDCARANGCIRGKNNQPICGSAEGKKRFEECRQRSKDVLTKCVEDCQ